MSRKIRLLFDANPLVRQKTGVGYYTQGVISVLAKIPELELHGHYFAPRGPLPPLPQAGNISYSHNSWLVGQAVKALRKLGLRLPWELLARQRADVLFFPDFTTWPSLFGRPKILTVHDLTFIDHPEWVQKRNLRYLRRFVRRDAQKAALVLTISEFSKQRMVKEFGLPAAKILVQPIPPAPMVKPEKTNLPTDFILFISTIEPRKNLGGLLQAYSRLPEPLRQKHPLVIAGGVGWNADDTVAEIKNLQAAGEQIISLGYVSDGVRSALYQKAALVVVPSFYEGFGMPLLEAMAAGAPVAASDLPVLREIGGSAVRYFDPNSPTAMASTVQKLLSDKALRTKLVQQGEVRAQTYSWPAVAQAIFERISKLAN